MPERRQYKRFEIGGSVILKVGDKPSRSIQAELKNISFLGFGVHAREEIKPDTEVQFELKAKLIDETLVGKGRIKHAAEIKKAETNFFRIGVVFVHTDTRLLQHFLNRIQSAAIGGIRKKEELRRKKVKSFSLDF